MTSDNSKRYRTLHLKIKPGETVRDREGTRYTNHNPKVAIRLTVIRENQPLEQELFPNEQPQSKNSN